MYESMCTELFCFEWYCIVSLPPDRVALKSRTYEKLSQKKSHSFRRFPLFSILYIDLIEFSENQDEEFKLGPTLFQSR